MTISVTASAYVAGCSDSLSTADAVLESREKRQPVDSAKRSKLLQLPQEIRDIIIEYVISSSEDDDDTYRTLPIRLSMLCRQTAIETRQLYRLRHVRREVLGHFWSPQQIYTGRDRYLIMDHCIPCLLNHFHLTPPWSLFHPFESYHTKWTAQLLSYATEGNEPATVHIEARSMGIDLARSTEITVYRNEVIPRTIEITLAWKSISCGFRYSNTLHHMVKGKLPEISMQVLDVKSWSCIKEQALASGDQGWIRADLLRILVDMLAQLSGMIDGAVYLGHRSMAVAVCDAFVAVLYHLNPDSLDTVPTIVRKFELFRL